MSHANDRKGNYWTLVNQALYTSAGPSMAALMPYGGSTWPLPAINSFSDNTEHTHTLYSYNGTA
uniref:Tail fiber protein n=1 Tax=Heterorhabditis bacteriophora TaxID=37862 RepID=A0A1I7XDN6_HETBA